MGMISRTMILVVAVAAVAGCDLVRQIDTAAYREFHQSRWTAVVDAYARREVALELPHEPTTPRVCAGLEPAYPRIITQSRMEEEDWERLNEQSRTAVQFVAEMLDVLVSRDTLNLEKLAPQIDNYTLEHGQLRSAWLDQREQAAKAVSDLTGLWQEVWPGNDLGFDLAGDARALSEKIYIKPDQLRSDALAHYHANEYDRLAMVYLDYTPVTTPQPQSHIPADCDDLAVAIRHLEAGLMVRYSMDRAIEQDVARIQDLAGIDLSQTPWNKIEMPSGRYARPRVSAAIARLKLLKYLDELLTDCLDILVGEVERQWGLVWPGNGLETNIFAHAGLAEAILPPDPLAIPTLRK